MRCYSYLSFLVAAGLSGRALADTNAVGLAVTDLDQAFGADALAAHNAAKPSLRVRAAVADTCGAGGSCGKGAFCSPNKQIGLTCVSCPTEEEHCKDFDVGATDCSQTCFQEVAGGAPMLGVGRYGQCPAGGCCGNQGQFACGCGWFQEPILKTRGDCRSRCGNFYGSNCD